MRSPPKFWQRHYSNKGVGGKFHRHITTCLASPGFRTFLRPWTERFANQWKIEWYKGAFFSTKIGLYFFRDCHLRHPMYRLIIFRRYLLLTRPFLQKKWQIFLKSRTVIKNFCLNFLLKWLTKRNFLKIIDMYETSMNCEKNWFYFWRYEKKIISNLDSEVKKYRVHITKLLGFWPSGNWKCTFEIMSKKPLKSGRTGHVVWSSIARSTKYVRIKLWSTLCPQ